MSDTPFKVIKGPIRFVPSEDDPSVDAFVVCLDKDVRERLLAAAERLELPVEKLLRLIIESHLPKVEWEPMNVCHMNDCYQVGVYECFCDTCVGGRGHMCFRACERHLAEVTVAHDALMQCQSRFLKEKL